MDLEAEFNSLSPFIRANLRDKFAGWKAMRDRFLGQFGGIGNSAASIRNANSYYAQLVEAKFPAEEFSRPSGRLTPVHPELRRRLDRGVALLRAKGVAADALGHLANAGGFIIRENANNANELSLHSFGWALDLDPELNPNIKKKTLPILLIQHFTATDIYGEHSEQLRNARPFDELLPHATALVDASKTFVHDFSSPDAVRSALQRAFSDQFEVTLSQQDVVELERLVGASNGSNDNLVAKLTDLGVAHSVIDDAEAMLRECLALFGLRQRESRPRVQGTAASIAAFGFVGLPPALIAALVAADGGGLTWLGASRGTKDFMHFELGARDRPRLHS